MRWWVIGVGGLIVVVALGVGALWLIGFSPLRIWAFISAPRVTDVEAERAGRTLTRTYPAVIKGNWEPSTFHLDQILAFEVDSLQAMGVNTVSVVAHYDYRDGVAVLRDSVDQIRGRILRAKEAGFAVMLVPDFVGGDNTKATVPLEQFLDDSTRIARQWALVAEELKVEYFAPQNEFDWYVRWSFFEDDPTRLPQAVKVANDWHRDVLAEITPLYHGKTIYKLTTESPEIGVPGYDYLGVDFGHYQRSLAEFRAGIRRLYAQVARAAEQHGTEWLVAEAWIPYLERRGPGAGDFLKASDGTSIEANQHKYFEVAIEEYQAVTGPVKPSGFIFIAYLMESMDIKDRPAEAVLTSFFQVL